MKLVWFIVVPLPMKNKNNIQQSPHFLSFYVPIAISIALFATMVYAHGNEDLWNDEIYTLRFFVFKGLPSIVTDYHVPNNHIFSNILHAIWLFIFHPKDLGILLTDAWKIRLLPILLSIGTVYLLFRVCQKQWGAYAGWTAVIGLLTTLCFGHFAFQIRGYALTMLLSVVLMSGALRVLRAGQVDRYAWWTLAGASAGLLYTIPSNLYMVLSVMFLLPLTLGWQRRLAYLSLGTAFLAGFALTFALYFPVLHQALNNEYIEARKPFQHVHFQNIRTVFLQFWGWRLLLLPLLVWGWSLLRKVPEHHRVFLFLAGVCLLPFVFSMFRGDTPPERAYLVLLPVFILLLTLCWQSIFELGGTQKRLAFSILGILVAVFSYVFTWYGTARQIEQSLTSPKFERYQDLNKNYYQYVYEPNLEFDLFKQKYGSNKTLILETTEEHDLPDYLLFKGLKSAPIDSINGMIDREKTLYVSTRYPKSFIQEIQKLPGGWTCTYLQPKPRYPRIVVCVRK